MDGSAWTSAVEVQSVGSPTVLTFAPARAKFVRVTSTSAGETPMSVGNLKIFEVKTASR